MHLIVDGYNVMGQSPRLQFLDVMDLQAGREALLELLALYRSRSHHPYPEDIDKIRSPSRVLACPVAVSLYFDASPSLDLEKALITPKKFLFNESGLWDTSTKKIEGKTDANT